MKNSSIYFRGIFAGALSFVCATASATDWLFDYSKGYSALWSTSGGSQGVDGYWKTSDGTHIQNALPTAEDSLRIGDASNTGPIYLTMDTSATIKTLYFSGNGNNSARITNNGNLTITGDVVRLAGTSQAFFYGSGTLNIGGKIEIQGGGNMSVESKKFVLGGDLLGSSSGGNLYFKVNNQTNKTFDQGLANPDILINGVLNSASFTVKDNNYDNFVQLSGATGSAVIGAEAQAGKSGTTYIVFNNTADYSASGGATELTWPGFWNNTCGKCVIVMNGVASQSFTSQKMLFFGGVKAMKGSVKINFNQDASLYEYYSTTSASGPKVRAYKSNDGAVRTAFSHGELEMLGGTFGATDEASSYGQFRFTNIVYTDGTIQLRLNAADKIDSLDLTSYYTKNSSIETYDFVAGGTLSKTEGADKVKFDFGNSLEWLIDAENDGVKVISWDSVNKSALTAEDFIANTFTNTSGEEFKAQFAVNDDGLYVKYVAVPEPATIAAIFGALALALTAYRRRK